MRWLSRAASALTARQEGFTIIEAMVAVILIVVGIGAVIGSFPLSQKQTLVAQRQAVAAAVAGQELERLASLPFKELVLSAQPVPANPSNPNDPQYYAQGGKFLTKAKFGDSSSTTLYSENLCIVGGSGCTGVTGMPAGPVAFVSGAIKGNLYRFISWKTDSCVKLPKGLPQKLDDLLLNLVSLILGSLQGPVQNVVDNATTGSPAGPINVLQALCTGTQHAKRITVVVQLDRPGNGAAPLRPVYFSTLVPNPNQGALFNLP